MIGIVIITVTAFLFCLFLVFLEARLERIDPQKEGYLERLPGYNCGACGFGSCTGMSEAMMKDPTLYQKCKPMRGVVLEKMEAYLKERGELQK